MKSNVFISATDLLLTLWRFKDSLYFTWANCVGDYILRFFLLFLIFYHVIEMTSIFDFFEQKVRLILEFEPVLLTGFPCRKHLSDQIGNILRKFDHMFLELRHLFYCERFSRLNLSRPPRISRYNVKLRFAVIFLNMFSGNNLQNCF